MLFPTSLSICCTRGTLVYMCKGACISILFAALFIIVKNWKNGQTGHKLENVSKLVYSHYGITCNNFFKWINYLYYCVISCRAVYKVWYQLYK